MMSLYNPVNTGRSLLPVLLVFLTIFPLFAAERTSAYKPEDEEPIRISLITCYPGPEVYALDGHEAIRVRTADSDSIWNYGIFDFNQPSFIYRFVKGETDYRLAGYPFAWFMPEYVQRGSRVVEQELNLTQEQAVKLRKILQTEGLPQNCVYRYNYLNDNCATRILDRLDSVSGSKIIYPQETKYGSWRDVMRHYHSGYPWYQFGIDFALGSGLDREMTGREEMFVPLIMMEKARGAHFADGRPLVREERVLFEGQEDATLPPTPWYLGPLFWSLVLLFTVLCFSIVSFIKRRIYRWPYAIFFLIAGIAGSVIAFLVFVSEHEATSPNLLLLWLNPLLLIYPLCIWSRRTRPLCKALSIAYGIVVLVLIIVWPLQNQEANPAFFPLMGATLIMAGTYAIISLSPSYNKIGEKGASKRISRSNRKKGAR